MIVMYTWCLGNNSIIDSLKIENQTLQNKILELELRKRINDSVTMNGSPILIEKYNSLEKCLNEKVSSSEKVMQATQIIFSGFLVLIVLAIGVIGWTIWHRSNEIARITAKDEFDKAFKEYKKEIDELAADAKEKHGEITGYHKAITKMAKSVLNIENIKRRNKDGQ